MSISYISSLCLNVTGAFALNCHCVVVLSMRSIKSDCMSWNCSANKPTQSDCSDEIKRTSHSAWVKMETGEQWTQQKQSLRALVLALCELMSCKFQNIIQRRSRCRASWVLLGSNLMKLQNQVPAISDWYLNRSKNGARICIACPGFFVRKHLCSCKTDFSASYHCTQLSFSDFISATWSEQGTCFP